MDNIPVEIALDIFSRLPIDTVLECRRVCVTWRNILVTHIHSRLSHHHHDHNNGVVSKVCSGLIFMVNPIKKCYDPVYYYGELDQNGQWIHYTLGTINHPFLSTLRTGRNYRMKKLVGSCNGLICLAELQTRDHLYQYQDPINIYNPITKECLHLQGFNENNEHRDVYRIYSGFGYIPQTNEYKVVRILYDDCSGIGDVQVYTIGDGNGWRSNGVITSWLYEHGVFANGAIHWLSRNRKDIVVFNLSDEKFHVLPVRPFSGHTYKITSILGSLGECLCVSGCAIEGTPECLDIWTFKKTSSGKSIIASNDTKDESLGSWCKEFSITINGSSAWHYEPFAFTKSGLVLLKHRHYKQTLFSYDPKRAVMKRLGRWNNFEAIPHTNSFVSLEALGETSPCKKRKLI